MALAILGTAFWGIAGPIIGFILVTLGFVSFAIAMDYVDKIGKHRQTRQAARRAFLFWLVATIWTVAWVWMLVISILNWVNIVNHGVA